MLNAQNLKNYEKIMTTDQKKSEWIEKDNRSIESHPLIEEQNYRRDREKLSQNQTNTKKTPIGLNLEVRKSTRNDVATIILQVYGQWSAGAQMLIDADHQLYDKYHNGYYTGNAGNYYDDADYKIPATANLYGSVIVNGEGSVEVPEGIYDFIFLQPDNGGVYVFYWETFSWQLGIYDRAVMDDYTFLAGYEYIFSEDMNLIYFNPERDAALTEIILPQASPDLTHQEDVSIKLANKGIHSFSGVNLSYRVNNGTVVTETYNETLEPNEEITYTFTAKADFSIIGIHDVEAWVDYGMDMKFWNDTITGKTQKFSMQLPFFDNFNSVESLLRWTIIDANNDGWTWKYSTAYLDAEDGYGTMQADGPWAGDGSADDYLISNQIFFPEQGTYNLSFSALSIVAIGGEIEKLRILYGTSSNYEEMELLEEFTITSSAWEIMIKNFTIETPGSYYFALYYCSTPQYLWGTLLLDNVRIAEGAYVPNPDIKINTILTPPTSCEISNGFLGAIVSNYGTTPINEFTITIQIADNTPVTQTFYTTIGIRESIEIYFDETLNFSESGEYVIKLTVETPNELPEYTSNNITETTIKIVTPITELPFESNFSNIADRANWNPAIPNGWAINYDAYYWAREVNVPLLSRCVSLEPNVYNLSYTFWAGYFEATDDFYVTFGKLGTSPSTWTPVKEYYNFNTNGMESKDDVTINITEQGEYIFAFVATRLLGTVRIYDVTLALLPEHDFKINNIESYSFPRMIPKKHIEGEKKFTVTVENKGSTAVETGKVEIKCNSEIVGSKNFAFSSTASIIDVDVDAVFNPFPTGNIKLTFNVSFDSGLAKLIELNKIVSDSTFVWDNIDGGFTTGVGINGRPCALGLIYELGKTDTLTSINVGLYERGEGFSDDERFELACYLVNHNMIVEDLIFESTFTRGAGNNEKGITFDIPDIEMTPGKYFFEIRQLDENNIAIAYDEDPEGYFYDNSDNYLNKISGFGYIHLRPNFGDLPPVVNIAPYNITEHQLTLYPNPVTETLNVKLENENIHKIVITNILGKVIHQESAIHTSLYQYKTTELNSGLYFISVHTQNGVINSKFLVR